MKYSVWCAVQVADVAVVTATRDGMNLVPYEYVVCRQGPPGWADPDHKPQSMLVVSGEHRTAPLHALLADNRSGS